MSRIITRAHCLIVTLLIFISSIEVKGQLSHSVLFLGNSYTGVNNLPQLVHDVALSAGDTLVFDSHTPGGYQLEDHVLNVTSQNKIMAGNWDYVVMQGQSQEPIVFSNQFFTGGNALHSLIKQYNPCAVTMPYMTWGRKNGDAANCPFFPILCTYQGMDTTLRNRYLQLTENINGEVSPVSVVWNYLRQNNPSIELYQPDESHPSLAGSYAAACCFYAALLKKDPTLITYNAGLSAADASAIRSAVKTQVFDIWQVYDYKKLPVSDFNYQVGAGNNEIIFNPANQGVLQSYYWDFGDSTNTTTPNPTHSFLLDGTYTVTLTTTNCDLQGLHTSVTDTIIQFCSHTPTVFTSQPWLCYVDTLWTAPADTYQWFVYGQPIPETGQFLGNYADYGLSGFSVKSSINGCMELSQAYVDTPEWSGYFFDLIGDPCDGDTVAFAVLHFNGSLTGSENILWYKNDTLLPLMTNEDTLLITGGGKYECKVINPTSICPLDTTWYAIVYNCDVTGTVSIIQKPLFRVYPNPVSDILNVSFNKMPVNEIIKVYNTLGILVKTIFVSSADLTIHVEDLPGGIYYLRLRDNDQLMYKFVRL